ncbi:MAG: transposase domain-containing protein [Firmicutes bacterium]|nr:transposase domain-containing protein [Bacillota bacterium]
MIYSIVETAKELNPLTYLTYLFEQLSNIDVKDQTALNKLLPWSSGLPAGCCIRKARAEKPAS